MTTQHEWPKVGADYRRFRFDNPRRTTTSGESYMRDFSVWLLEEFQGFLPDIVAAERVEVRPSAHPRADYNLPEVLIRWHVCVEVSDFKDPGAHEETALYRLWKFLGLPEGLPIALPLRETRYYSFSPRQYERFRELMGVES